MIDQDRLCDRGYTMPDLSAPSIDCQRKHHHTVTPSYVLYHSRIIDRNLSVHVPKYHLQTKQLDEPFLHGLESLIVFISLPESVYSSNFQRPQSTQITSKIGQQVIHIFHGVVCDQYREDVELLKGFLVPVAHLLNLIDVVDGVAQDNLKTYQVVE